MRDTRRVWAGRIRSRYGIGVYEPTTAVLPPPPRRTGRTVLLVIGLVVLGCCVAGTAAIAIGAALHRAGPSATPARTPGIGEAVRDGKFEFVVSSMACGQSEIVNGILRAKAQGQFCVATMSVRNIGTQPRQFADGNQKAFSPDGIQYAADTGAGVVANGSGVAYWDTINPGNSVQAKVVFDIPPGSTISLLELHDSLLSGGVRVVVTPT
jgi:hypothetical protein